MTEFVTAATLASVYGVSAETISAWARDEKIPTAMTTPGGHRRFRLADVLAVVPITGVTAESAAAAIAERSETVA